MPETLSRLLTIIDGAKILKILIHQKACKNEKKKKMFPFIFSCIWRLQTMVWFGKVFSYPSGYIRVCGGQNNSNGKFSYILDKVETGEAVFGRRVLVHRLKGPDMLMIVHDRYHWHLTLT